MKTKLITNLTAMLAEGDHHEPHGTLQHVAHFPHEGCICQLKLGAAGLQYQRGEHHVAIPIAELINLFETLHPPFAEPPVVPPTNSPSRITDH